jgi:hypothetical protein
MSAQTISRKRILLTAAFLLAAALLVGVATLVRSGNAAQPKFVPDPYGLRVQNRTVDASTLQVARSVSVSGVTWNVVSYQSSDGPCLAVEGELAGTSEAGGVTGCGVPKGRGLLWVTGGVAIGDAWYDIVVGQLPAGAVSARLALADGSQILDRPPASQNVWVGIVASSGPADSARDVLRIEALDASGNVIDAVVPPPLPDYRAEIPGATGPTG